MATYLGTRIGEQRQWHPADNPGVNMTTVCAVGGTVVKQHLHLVSGPCASIAKQVAKAKASMAEANAKVVVGRCQVVDVGPEVPTW